MSLSIVTIGNPNSGKTTLFNALTGSHQKVGNWSGDDDSGASLDERVAFEYIMQSSPDIVLNIIDASCLERSLYLTLQLLELGLPVLVVLNKMDLAEKQNLVINETLLSKQLGCPVVSLSALDQVAVKQLTQVFTQIELDDLGKIFTLDYGSTLQPIFEKTANFIPQSHRLNA